MTVTRIDNVLYIRNVLVYISIMYSIVLYISIVYKHYASRMRNN